MLRLPSIVLASTATSRQGWPMPEIIGQVVILTVSDAHRSAAWYCDLLGTEETSRYVQPDGHVALVHLAEPHSNAELCLVDHGADPGNFNEFRAGLDHLEFLVAQRSDLDAWACRLRRAGSTPLRRQGTFLHRECRAHLPRPRQHPAGVLLARAHVLTGDAGGCPDDRVAVRVAVHHHAAPSKEDRSRMLVQVDRSGRPRPELLIRHTVRRESTATSPHSRQRARPPAHRASWDDGQTPSGALKDL